MEENSVDSLVTDPPAGISFMGKEWDHGDNFIERMREIFAECLRVMKPGAHGLVWALPKTSHWTATALEQAGFEVRDVVTHLFGTGFPKSLNLGEGRGTALKPAVEHWILVRKKDIKEECQHEYALIAVKNTKLTMRGLKEGRENLAHMLAESNLDQAQKEKILLVGRAVVGSDTMAMSQLTSEIKSIDLSIVSSWKDISAEDLEKVKTFIISMATKPITELKILNFSRSPNTQKDIILEPSSEHYILIRKPISEKTVAKNVGRWGCGGLNIDGCRIEAADQAKFAKNWDRMQPNNQSKIATSLSPKEQIHLGDYTPTGRFPSNLVLDEESAAMLDEQSGLSKSVCIEGGATRKAQTEIVKNPSGWVESKRTKRTEGFNDSGGASRFFYVAKASRSDRNEGCEKNGHPCVKSTKLMEYLIKLITPPNGIVLDPFMGSGSTGKACKRLGFGFIGIEKEKEYFDIAKARVL